MAGVVVPCAAGVGDDVAPRLRPATVLIPRGAAGAPGGATKMAGQKTTATASVLNILAPVAKVPAVRAVVAVLPAPSGAAPAGRTPTEAPVVVPVAPARGVVGRGPIPAVPGPTLVAYGAAGAASPATFAIREEADASAGASETAEVQGVPPAEANAAAASDGREAFAAPKTP